MRSPFRDRRGDLAGSKGQIDRVQSDTPTMNPDNMALLCSIYACDRAGKQIVDLPLPGTPECNGLFLATWAAFRHVTTELGRQRMIEEGITRVHDPLEAFVHGRQIPAHLRWAETEAMIRAGEWSA